MKPHTPPLVTEKMEKITAKQILCLAIGLALSNFSSAVSIYNLGIQIARVAGNF